MDTLAAVKRVLAFVNTRDFDFGTDELDSPAALRQWLVANHVRGAGGRLTSQDLTRAKQLREGLRSALLAHHADGGGTGDKTASAVLATVPLELNVAANGEVFLSAGGDGFSQALADLVAGLPAAVADGTWERAKVCPRDDCQWAFLDESRNRSRRWCSMKVCGNREKTESFRERRRESD